MSKDPSSRLGEHGDRGGEHTSGKSEVNVRRTLGAPDFARFNGTQSDILAHLSGDAQAFGRLWIRFQPGLEALVRGRIRLRLEPALRAKLDAEIDDLLQEAATTVLAGIERFEYRGNGSLLAWMSRITEHAVSDRAQYWAAARRHPRRIGPNREMAADGTNDAGDAVGDVVAGGPGPGTEAAGAEDRRRVVAAMARLPDRLHDVVHLRFFGGASWEEIAVEVGAVSADAVRMECFGKALPALSELLKGSDVP
ncbi:MAG: hypothetical protein HYR85_11795 [Planctomycetes bacterium]|nr:hypothetical protein [Planctomycetota bacterium]MBI3843967.1 hypothetical protein [Planctomycetota bacterium]